MNTSNYIRRVVTSTPTRLWINNPTGTELKQAVDVGAIAATTNPSYCSKLIRKEESYISPIITDMVRKSDEVDTVADLVYQEAAKRIMNAFLPRYERSSGTKGFVTMQDNPYSDDDPSAIVAAAFRHNRVGRNYMAKIPVTEEGMEAIQRLVREDIPICATECFSVSQATRMCELYQTTAKRYDTYPPFYITHITGIFDEEMSSYVQRERISIAPDLLAAAGTIVARKIYGILLHRGYNAHLLGGGARRIQHFTEFVGGDVHVTLNWDTIEQLITENPPLVRRIDVEADPKSITELSNKLPDFARAYEDDGLSPSGFKSFAPVQRFRNSFVRGWNDLRKAVSNATAI